MQTDLLIFGVAGGGAAGCSAGTGGAGIPPSSAGVGEVTGKSSDCKAVGGLMIVHGCDQRGVKPYVHPAK